MRSNSSESLASIRMSGTFVKHSLRAPAPEFLKICTKDKPPAAAAVAAAGPRPAFENHRPSPGHLPIISSPSSLTLIPRMSKSNFFHNKALQTCSFPLQCKHQGKDWVCSIFLALFPVAQTVSAGNLVCMQERSVD